MIDVCGQRDIVRSLFERKKQRTAYFFRQLFVFLQNLFPRETIV